MRIKTIPGLFLIMASFSLLVLNMFPHHHHDGEFCFVPSHMHTSQSERGGFNDRSHHDDGAAGCILNHLTVTLTPGCKYSTKAISREVFPGNGHFVQSEFLFTGSSLFKPDFQSVWLAIKSCSPTHQYYLKNPRNLRAPPQV